MKHRDEYISLLQSHSDELRADFGVRSLCIFGSVARGRQREGSDVYVF